MSDSEGRFIIQSHIICDSVKKVMEKLGEESREYIREDEGYKQGRAYLLRCLETYREQEPGSPRQRFIDFLVEKHKKAFSFHGADEFYKVRHNLLVMTYLLEKPYTKRQVINSLGITGPVYDRNLQKGIDELMIHAFGVYGLPRM